MKHHNRSEVSYGRLVLFALPIAASLYALLMASFGLLEDWFIAVLLCGLAAATVISLAMRRSGHAGSRRHDN